MDVNTLIALAGIILALPAAILSLLQIRDRKTPASSQKSQPASVPVLISREPLTKEEKAIRFQSIFCSLVAGTCALALGIIALKYAQISYDTAYPYPTYTTLDIVTGIGLILIMIWAVCAVQAPLAAGQRLQAVWCFILSLSSVSGLLELWFFLAHNNTPSIWLYPAWILPPFLYLWLARDE